MFFSFCPKSDPQELRGYIGVLSASSLRYFLNPRSAGVSPHLHLQVYLNGEDLEGSISLPLCAYSKLRINQIPTP